MRYSYVMSNYLDFGIYLYLSCGKNVSAKFLADTFEVSKKTIYRHVNNLVYAGLPITTSTGKNGGIILNSSQFFITPNLTKNEVEFIYKILNNSPLKTHNESKVISAKLYNFLKNSNI